MQIFINAEGNATIVTSQHIYQGSNISQINVVSLAFTPQTTLQIAFVLPDGTTTNYYPMSFNYSSTNTNYYQYIIQQAFTALSGSASIALLATDSQTQQQTSQLIPFTIEPSVLPTLPDTPSQDEWTTLLQYVQQNSSNIANLQAIISDIETIANTANTNASQAVSVANEALSTAQQAEQTANGLEDSIAQANTNASQAVSTANEAKTTADGLAASIAQANETANEAKTTADGLAESIAQANETASQAVSTANQAVTTANQANQTAEQALQQVVEKQGTVVSVGNNYVPTLDFTSDPQTQINNNSALIQKINSGNLSPRCDNYQNFFRPFSYSGTGGIYIKIGSLKSFIGETQEGVINTEITGYISSNASAASYGIYSFSISAYLTTITNGIKIITITQKENTSTILKQVICDNYDIIFYVEGFTQSYSSVSLDVNFVYANGNVTPSISILSDYTPSEDAVIFNSNCKGIQTTQTIYDYSSDDPAINLGYPNGISGTSGADGVVTIDLTPYKFLRVYVKYAQNTNAIVLCDLTAPQTSGQSGGNIYKFNNLTMGDSTPPNGSIYGCQIFIPFTLNTLQIKNIGYYNSSLEWIDRVNSETNEYYIYRIEGVK